MLDLAVGLLSSAGLLFGVGPLFTVGMVLAAALGVTEGVTTVASTKS